MKVFEFQGEPVNLGRFGCVGKGEILVLTEKEANDIRDDRRFRPVKKPEQPVSERDALQVQILEIQGLGFEAARRRVKELQAQGKALDVRPLATHGQLITALLKPENLTD